MVVSAGATQALSLLANLLFTAGDLVFIENPTYFIAIKMLEHDVGLKAVTVPMDEYGVIPEELEKALEANKSHRPREITQRKPFWSLLYLMPTFHNPTGICLPPERCVKIIELARKYNLLVVCDDVYNLLYFPRQDGSIPRLKRLFAYDDRSDPVYKGNVISNGSFSKIFGPGIRLGWMEMPRSVKNIIMTSGMALSGGGFNHTASGIMTTVISTGNLTEVLREARRLNQGRCKAIDKVLRSKVPGMTFTMPQGGYFMWMKLPDGVRGTDLVKRCEEEAKVTFFTGDLASPTGDFGDYVRISFSHYKEDELVAAVEKMADILNQVLSGRT